MTRYIHHHCTSHINTLAISARQRLGILVHVNHPLTPPHERHKWEHVKILSASQMSAAIMTLKNIHSIQDIAAQLICTSSITLNSHFVYQW